MQELLIIADIHEPKRIIRGLVSAFGDQGVRVMSRKAGDYAFKTHQNEVVIVERKSCDDLMNSLFDNSLIDQLRNALRHGDIVYLLIEGWRTVDHDGLIRTKSKTYSVTWEFVENLLDELQDVGIKLRYSPNLMGTVRSLKSLYTLYQKEERVALKRVKRSRFKADHPGVEILHAIFQGGVDRKKALAILEQCGSVRGFDRASLKDRMRVPGIGRTLARKFDYYLDLPYKKEE